MAGDSRGKHKKMNRPNLPDDIVFDILSRLPVQSLLQFKSVCKSWLSIITQPHFVKAHLLRSAQSPSSPARLLLKPNFSPDPVSFLSFDFEAPNSRSKNLQCPTNYSEYSCLRPMCSCDGLILLWAYDQWSVRTSCKSFVLWNPSIRSYKRIICPYELPFNGNYGLFHDSIADDYRVLVVSQESETSVLIVVVYSSRDESWEIFVDDRYGLSAWEPQAAVVNGFVHWVMYSRELCSCVIVYFDLVEGKFKEVPLPSVWNEDDKMDLVVLGEFLCVYCDISRDQIKIYAMKEYRKKESWTRLFVMPCAIDRIWTTFVKPLCRTKKGQVVVSVGITGVGLYDPKVGKFLWYNLYRGQMAIPYVETLVSLDGGV